MEGHINKITDAFSELVRTFNKFQLSDHTIETIKNGNSIVNDGNKLLSVLKHYTNAIESVIDDCSEYIDEITEDLSHKKPPEDFVYATSNGMLSYNGRDYLDKVLLKKENSNAQKRSSKHPLLASTKDTNMRVNMQSHNYTYKKHKINEIDYCMEFPTVSNFADMSPMFYYYDNPNDTNNDSGIYCSIIQGVVIKIPFPVIVDSTREYSRCRSIKCKYEKRYLCDENRNSMAQRYNSEIRKCNFAHEGDSIVKIGYPSRCSTMPRFGNADTLAKDINIVKLGDIKNVLLYGLNDVIVSAIWFYHHKQKAGVYSRVDVA